MHYLLPIIYITGGLALFLFGVQESSLFFRSSMPLVLRREQVREWLDQPESAGGLLRAVPPSLCCAESQDVPGTEAGFRV